MALMYFLSTEFKTFIISMIKSETWWFQTSYTYKFITKITDYIISKSIYHANGNRHHSKSHNAKFMYKCIPPLPCRPREFWYCIYFPHIFCVTSILYTSSNYKKLLSGCQNHIFLAIHSWQHFKPILPVICEPDFRIFSFNLQQMWPSSFNITQRNLMGNCSIIYF